MLQIQRDPDFPQKHLWPRSHDPENEYGYKLHKLPGSQHGPVCLTSRSQLLFLICIFAAYDLPKAPDCLLWNGPFQYREISLRPSVFPPLPLRSAGLNLRQTAPLQTLPLYHNKKSRPFAVPEKTSTISLPSSPPRYLFTINDKYFTCYPVTGFVFIVQAVKVGFILFRYKIQIQKRAFHCGKPFSHPEFDPFDQSNNFSL